LQKIKECKNLLGKSGYVMRKERLEGRLNAQKQEFLSILKEEGHYVECSKEKGFIYEVVRPVFGVMNKIKLSLKNGKIIVHDMQKIS